MSEPRRLQMPDGVSVLVPKEGRSMTAFVLEELGDWFEDELPFLRRVVRPGWTCVDAGACYGCYALSMAAATGAGGKVHAIEPQTAVLAYLRQGIKASGAADRITLHEVAIAEAAREGTLSSPEDPELARLVTGDGSEVDVEPLDEVITGSVDLLKLDVEDGGTNALLGARRILADGSPVVQFVARHDAIQARSIDMLLRMGYLIYRLVPGLGVIEPLSPGVPLEGSCINVFAMRPASAAKLEEAGLAVTLVQDDDTVSAPLKVQAVLDRLAAQAWTIHVRPNWGPNAIVPGWDNHRRAVGLAAAALSGDLPSEQRVIALRQALRWSRTSIQQGLTGSRVFTAVRIAYALGLRSEANAILGRTFSAFFEADDETLASSFREPLMLPMPWLEEVVYPDLRAMVCGASIEAAMYSQVFSAYFYGRGPNPLLERLAIIPVRSQRAERVLRMRSAVGSRPVMRL